MQEMIESLKDKNDESKEFNHDEKWRIYKNVIMYSVAFMIHFTAFGVNFD
jgi:hypothetical protein